MNALKHGFQEILPLDSLRMFDEKEVEVWKSIKQFYIQIFSSSF
jgi:hypothetical protein